jgi:hypothetical protein
MLCPLFEHPKGSAMVRKILIVTCLMFVYASPISAQEESHLQITVLNSKWVLPEPDCELFSCRMSLSETGVLYLFVVETHQLYVAQPDGTPPIQYDLSRYSEQLYAASPGFDYEGFEEFVAFFTPLHDLYRFDFESNDFIPFNVNRDIRLVSCDFLYIAFPIRELLRFAPQDKVLTCGAKSGANHLYIVNLEQDLVEADVYVGPRPEGGECTSRCLLSWITLQTGLDNAIYLGYPRHRVPAEQSLVLATGRRSREHMTILRYDLQQAQWTALLVPHEAVSPAYTEWDSFVVLPPDLAGIDSSGNLYFYTRWSEANRQRHIDITKVNPLGEQIWRLTEAEVGKNVFFEALMGEDRFILSRYRSDGGLDRLIEFQVTVKPWPGSQR